MNALSEKIFLQLKMPTEDTPISDHSRILMALETLGYENVTVSLPVLRKLYPLCRNHNFDITATLVHTGRQWALVDVQPGDTTGQHYGLAIDYGSTTIIMELVDVNTGRVLATEKAVNGQTVFGTDILTRITYAMESPQHMDDLQKATLETFSALLTAITEKTGMDVKKVPVMVLSGNTTMIHFLLKLDAWTVFAAPYAPVTSDPGFFSGQELGMDFGGMVYILPAASNYVGGDIISGLTHLGMHKSPETSLFFDIGTNGELVLGNENWLLAGAGAAGPALEGYISRWGMRAAPGAIDTVKIQGRHLTFTTIDSAKPVGICGSGIIDLLAQMRLHGWINIAGELEPAASDRIITTEDGQLAAVYATAKESATGEALYFSQTDIHQYLDTKAAAYTMVECLLESAGVSMESLDRVYLSGAFTAHSDLESAITIGMFPDLPREKFTVIGNTSLDGARQILLQRGLAQQASQLAQSLYCLQFASVPDFLVRMQAAKFIPHTDLDRYPTIRARLEA